MDAARHLKVLEPYEFYRRLIIDEGVHEDGRQLKDFRKTVVRSKVVSSGDGSVLVRHGHTAIMCVVKAALAEPCLAAPDRGCISISFESSISMTDYEQSQLDEATEILASLVNGDGCIVDRRQLSVVSGKMCWILYCDLLLVDCSGAVLDTALLALTSALSNTALPAVRKESDELDLSFDNLVVEPSVRTPLKLINTRLVASTFLICENDCLVCDPTDDESELLGSSLLSIVVGDGDQLWGVYKFGGKHSVSDKVLADCIAIAQERQHKLTPADA